MSMHVIVAGGGIGGLALAQGLRRNGIEVTVLERDPSPAIRGQGYRIHIDDNGGAALNQVLTPGLFDLYQATSTKAGARRIVTLDHHGTELHVIDLPPHDGPVRHTAVNRQTLRQILLDGLPVRFGSRVTGAEEREDGIRALLADGSHVDGDVLVAADGVGSALRAAIAPAAEVADTGLRCVYGRSPLRANERTAFTAALGPAGSTLVFAAYDPRHPIAELDTGVALDPVDGYLMWALITTDDLPEDAAELHRHALDVVRDWDPALRDIVASAEVGATFPITIRTSTRVGPWPSGRLTALGDAIHAMSPAGGVGANTALRDAALLTRALAAVDRGESELVPAIAAYEEEMREYAFEAVETSAAAARSLVPGVPS
ncbi:FAD-dependent oxidoreductase [Amycolatopsis sp. CA-230715]|uniref:FAD-dependent oxidoreductase n=1 Tax=Amycolatopsis sp. CA-230715 TaxID=2745196 RepID=UPI001C026556|nr:FAD-dependent monooxygenase [Amycolatopsis sp. CA-230715]QWF82832.1 FAD-dependent urate hydroxylase [Amycolatopsis sp. CA-230715]